MALSWLIVLLIASLVPRASCFPKSRKSASISKDRTSEPIRRHEVQVSPLPTWVPVKKLLGVGDWKLDDTALGKENGRIATASLSCKQACDVAARLRGLGMGGFKIELLATPPLPRLAVRSARTDDARNRRVTSVGFTKKGVRLDEEGKFSLTPERIAKQMADRVRGMRVVDATCGAGGNAIAFAKAECDVVAIERNKKRLGLAMHNARIYGATRIQFLHGDAMDLVPSLSGDVLFVDPPWGTEYDRVCTPLEALPLLRDVIPLAKGKFSRIVAKVPPSFDPRTIPGATPEAWFGHEEGDQHRVKFLTLDIDLLS